ncbi:hypothetical protein D1641_12045 [Colidextribacter sp. OB.20]|uniref:hypothetical protein n=1 Tax=Colidextribacter sp. OB.20 TaxID=2304568 RepID=UPI0013710AB8|nr:hypothetical protein [Colidextribacter sp. OB.20]NBI10737.1 hypothetical protein [Colidextribacter sp. OB.20]
MITNEVIFMNINDRVRKLEEQRRRRDVMVSRLCANIKRQVSWIATVLALVSGWLACAYVRIPFPGVGNLPGLVMIWDYAIMLLILLLSMLAALVILTMPPLHTKDIESGLQHIALVDRYGFSPALVLNQGLEHSNIRELRFYSRGIAKETWIKRQSAVEDVLNVHWIEEPQYGGRRRNNRNYIVLIVAPGAESKREEPLYDDEL